MSGIARAEGRGPVRLYLASGNAHKISEFQALAALVGAGLPRDGTRTEVEIHGAAEIGGMPQVVEDTGTFEGNAHKKAMAIRDRLPEDAWSLADDSGLCVDALHGAPGVESAYFAGPKADPAANLAKLVAAMADVAPGRRAAHFVCVLVLCGPAGVEHAFEGRCPGRLSREPRGRGGFGYDPLFIPDGFQTTLAEMPAELKNRVSHRARAWLACVGWLAARRQTVL